MPMKTLETLQKQASQKTQPQSGDSFERMMMDQKGVAYRSASKRGNCGKIGLGSEDKASFRLKIQIWAQAWAQQIELILAQARALAYPHAIPIRLGLNNIWPGPAKLLPFFPSHMAKPQTLYMEFNCLEIYILISFLQGFLLLSW